MERLLVLVGIVVVSFNLRPAAVSVGPVLAEVTDDLGMSSTVAGVLTTLPVLAFATFGMLTPGVAARVGLHRVTLGARGWRVRLRVRSFRHAHERSSV
jgi:CP family cyanate transporter-like MFS transporter